jgi:hypothetical protein
MIDEFCRVALLYHGLSAALLGCSPAAWAIDTYVSTYLAHRRPADVPAFRRMTLNPGDDPSPDRDTAA